MIKVKSATKDGYEIAKEGDSINLTQPNSKTRRGRVGVIVDENSEIKEGDKVEFENKILTVTTKSNELDGNMVYGHFDNGNGIGVHKDNFKKITHTLSPLSIEGIPMIGEPVNQPTKNINDLVNEILKITCKAVPKKCSLDGNKLIEVHNELSDIIKVIQQPKALITDAEIENLFFKNCNHKDVFGTDLMCADDFVKTFKASQSLTPKPTSAVFTDDNNFIKFKY